MTTETTESQPGTASCIDQSISPTQQYETMESSAQQYETESDKYIAGSRTYPGPQPYKLGCSGGQFQMWYQLTTVNMVWLAGTTCVVIYTMWMWYRLTKVNMVWPAGTTCVITHTTMGFSGVEIRPSS